MASSANTCFRHDAIVCHSDDEYENAKEFCEYIKTNTLCSNGRRLDIITMEEFSHPGKTPIENHDDAIQSANYILFSEIFFEETLGNFLGFVAMAEKQPYKFVRLRFGEKKFSKSAAMSNLDGIYLCERWVVPPKSMTKFEKLFGLVAATPRLQKQEFAMPDLLPASHMGAETQLESPFSTELHYQRPTQAHLTIVNPSLPMTEENQRFAEVNASIYNKAVGQPVPGGLASHDLLTDSSNTSQQAGSTSLQADGCPQAVVGTVDAVSARISGRPVLLVEPYVAGSSKTAPDPPSTLTAQSPHSVLTEAAQGMSVAAAPEQNMGSTPGNCMMTVPGTDPEVTMVKEFSRLDISKQRPQKNRDNDSQAPSQASGERLSCS